MYFFQVSCGANAGNRGIFPAKESTSTAKLEVF